MGAAVPAVMMQSTERVLAELTMCVSSSCSQMFEIGHGFVPDVDTLYEQIRGGRQDRNYPLTQSEVLQFECCWDCANDKSAQEFGIKFFHTAQTLSLMRQWAQANVQKLDEELRRRDAARRRSGSVCASKRRREEIQIGPLKSAAPPQPKHGRQFLPDRGKNRKRRGNKQDNQQKQGGKKKKK